jgi:SAM-dependent methyltransferase
MYNGPTRFKGLPDNTFFGFKTAAEKYPTLLDGNESLGFHQKPLDWMQGHVSYFAAMYQLLNALRTLNLTPKSLIVEVGSGAGWATEILASLTYRVVCIEPSEDLIRHAQRRVQSYLNHFGVEQLYHNVTWHQTTMEEANLQEVADAVLFFESFHHVIDENKSLSNVYRLLKPGGALCIIGDSNWIPGNKAQEKFWQDEMNRFGTLESPFTREYLNYILRENRFDKITFNHAINGFVPLEREDQPVKSFIYLDATYYNLVTAVKPQLVQAGSESARATENNQRTKAASHHRYLDLLRAVFRSWGR